MSRLLVLGRLLSVFSAIVKQAFNIGGLIGIFLLLEQSACDGIVKHIKAPLWFW